MSMEMPHAVKWFGTDGTVVTKSWSFFFDLMTMMLTGEVDDDVDNNVDNDDDADVQGRSSRMVDLNFELNPIEIAAVTT